MQIANIMSSDVKVIPPDAPIRDAACQMRSLDVGSLPVCDGQKLLGMITDRDITVRAVAEGRDAGTPVREAMTPNVTYCYADDDVQQAVKLMEEKQIRRLPILDRNHRLVGILSLGDLAVLGHNDRMAGEALEQISQPLH